MLLQQLHIHTDSQLLFYKCAIAICVPSCNLRFAGRSSPLGAFQMMFLFSTLASLKASDVQAEYYPAAIVRPKPEIPPRATKKTLSVLLHLCGLSTITTSQLIKYTFELCAARYKYLPTWRRADCRYWSLPWRTGTV